MNAFAPDRRDWLRLLGGLLFACGAIVLVARKSNSWGDWAQFAAIAVPCVLLYAAALAGRRAWPVLQGWQSGFLAFAVLLLPLALEELVQAVGGTPGALLNITWVFALSAAVAVVTALVVRAWWQMLIGGLYVVVAWVALGTKVIDDKPNTIRWLFATIAVILALASFAAGRLRRPHGSDVMTAAGIAAIAAGVIGLAGLGGAVGGALGAAVPAGTAKPTHGWNIYLLVVSLLLIGYGVRSLTRGPAYAGAIGLGTFLVLAGANIVALINGDDPHTAAGWPLVLLIGGGVVLLLSFALRPGALGPPTGTTEPPAWRAPERAATAPASATPGYVSPGAPATPPREPGAPPPPPAQ